MPGIGPPPNRSGDYSRERDQKAGNRPELKKGEAKPVSEFEPDADWGKPAMMFWHSAKNSGMSEFYQDTEWAIIWFLCNEINAYLRKNVDRDGNEYPSHKISATMFGEIRRSMSELGFTEGDRRRMGIELEKPEEVETPASVTAIQNYKARLQQKRG